MLQSLRANTIVCFSLFVTLAQVGRHFLFFYLFIHNDRLRMNFLHTNFCVWRFFLAIISRVYSTRSLTLLALYHRLWQTNAQKQQLFIEKEADCIGLGTHTHTTSYHTTHSGYLHVVIMLIAIIKCRKREETIEKKELPVQMICALF